jgi:DNA polymerase-1
MASKKLPKLMIIDGNALIHRSFHALPVTLTTTKGEVVNAVYGFSSFLLKAIKELKPQMIALALDKKGPTFRHEQYKEYKATRVKAPDELYAQIPRVKDVATALNIPIFEVSGCEADDVIGTLAKRMGTDAEKIIVTGDMDTMQLIDKHTKVYIMGRGLADSTVYDEKAVQERYGLNVEQMIDYKALRGDPSDNIPGVRGIGEKMATELLQEFGTVKNLYKNLKSPKITARVKELLQTYKDDALMSYELATIKCDVDFPLDKKKLIFGGFNRDQALNLFKELEFRSLVPRLLQLENEDKAATGVERQARTEHKFSRNSKDSTYTIIDDDKAFKSFLKKLSAQKRFAFDTETSDLDNFTASLLGVSFSFKAGEGYFLSIRQPSVYAQKNKKADLFNWNKPHEKVVAHPWLKELKPIFENKNIKKVGHNIKFDIKILRQFGINVVGVDFDTMIAAYVINSGQRQYSLDALAMHYLEFEKISSEDLLGHDKIKLTFDTVPLERLGSYASEDADITWRLYELLDKKLTKEKIRKLFETIEMPLIDCLIDMELAGITLDEKYFAALDKELDQELAKTEKSIWKLSGQEFNIASPKQMQEILFTKLKISTTGLARTKTGISTGADELLKLKGRHKIIELILNYRELAKLSSTYVKTLPKLVNPVTGRVHTNFNQTIAATGRLSTTNHQPVRPGLFILIQNQNLSTQLRLKMPEMQDQKKQV